MIPEQSVALIRASDALLLDTNILLLDVVSELGQGWITRFKRTRDRFEESDSAILREARGHARRLLTTPHVLTETSNLLGQSTEDQAIRARARLSEKFAVLDEKWIQARDMNASDTSRKLFHRLGLTDWALCETAKTGVLVLTDDAALADSVERVGGRSLNFNHLRPFND